MDVSNTALVIAVRLMTVNQLLRSEWLTDWHSATFSSVHERESRPQRCESWVSDSTDVIHVLAFLVREWPVEDVNHVCVVTESAWTWITFANASDGVNVIDILSRSLANSSPARSRLSSTELRMERISSWSDFVHFVQLKDLFVWTTGLWPTKH